MATKQEVQVFIGIPGSMKSTRAKREAANNPNLVIINEDTFRFMFRGVYIYDRMTEPLVREVAGATLVLALRRGHDVIVDEANLTQEKRKELVELIRGVQTPEKIKITFVEFEPHDNCLVRRLAEDRGVPPKAWESLHKQMMEEYEPVDKSEGHDFLLKIPEPMKPLPDKIFAQKVYCSRNNSPCFIPEDGKCYQCNADIMGHAAAANNADKALITRCPYCGFSFVS